MKVSSVFTGVLAAILVLLSTMAIGQTWTPLTNEPPVSVGAMMLLTDGRVLVHEEPNCSGSGCVSTTNAYNNWYTLTPDSTGSYVNGTWAQVASLPTSPTNYAPLFFSSAVLPDGKVGVQGGEYNCPSAKCADAWQSNGALYDPVANTWTALTPEITSSYEADGDAQSVVLPNGTWMTAACCAVASGHSTFPEYYYFNESSLNFTNEASASDGETTEFDESGWNLLPNGLVLMVNVYLGSYSASGMGYALYNPATNTWTESPSSGTGSTLVQLWDDGCGSSSKASYELGPVMLMPNGTLFATGASECEAGNLATYNWSTNTWTAQGTFPNSDAANDAPGATEINGNAIVVTSPYTNTFSSPLTIYEWNGTTLSTFPNVSRASSDSSYVTHLLVLPTGQIMFTDFSTTVEILTSAGTYESAWQPAITSAPSTLAAGQTYSITGTQFNGVTTGAAYGDDFQDNTNYPLVRIVSTATGNVYYARTSGISSMGVAAVGSTTSVSTNFTVPATIPSGACELYVVANGIPSAASACEVGSLTNTTTTVSSNDNPSTYGQSVTLTATVAPGSSPTPTGTVSFTANSAAISGCTGVALTGSATAQCTTSALAGGSDAIVATYSGDSNYNSSTGSLTQTVSAASQTITFTTNAPSSAAYNSNFSVAATASSGLTVAYTSSGGCSNSGATYTMTSGTTNCSVIANQAGNANYSAAPTNTETTDAIPASQTITFTTPPPSSAGYNSHFTVAATGGGSGNAVTFTSSGVCTNSGATYTMTSSTGTCSVIANQAGNANYAAATQVTDTVTATTASQTITFTTNPPSSAPYNSQFTVAATASSGLTVAFTSSGSCSNSGATYTMTSGTGSCSVIANQAGNSSYAAAPTVTKTTTATVASQTITFTTAAPSSAEYGSSFTVAATASSGLSVAYTSSGSCSNSGATYTMTSSTGTCSVIANQSGNANYSAASQVTESTSAADSNGSVGVTSSQNPSISGNSVTFTATITSDTGAVKGRVTKRPKNVTGTVAWSSNTGCGTTNVTAGYPGTATCITSSLGVGTDAITATYSGDSNHNGGTGTLSGGQVVNSAQTSTSTGVVSSLTPSAYGQAVSFTATVSTASGTPSGTVQFTVDGNNFGSPVTLSGGSATSSSTSTLAVGAHAVTAVYGGTSSYAPSTGTLSGGQVVNSATAGTVVTSGANPSSYGQSVTFTATINGEYGQVKGRTTRNPRNVTGTVAWSSNTGCGTTNVTSGNPGTATCTTSSLGVGSDSVTGTYSGDANHSGSAGSFGQTVNQATNTVTFTTAAPASAEYGSSFTVAASGLGTGAMSYTSGGACSNSGSTYMMTSGAGTCTVTATQAADTNYQSGNATESVTAEPAQGSVSVALTSGTNPTTYGNSVTFTATVTSDTGAVKGRTTKRPKDLNGSVSWSANTGCSASTVSGNPPQTATCTTTTLGAGTDTVTGTYTASDSNHTTASGSVSQTINQGTQSITFTTPAPASAAYNSNFTVAASASSGLAVAYTSAGSCSNSGATYTMTSGSGSCFVIANQSGNTNYSAASQVTETVTATPLSQTITVTTSAPGTAVYKSKFTVAASAVTAVAYSSSGACTNSGATYTISAKTGTCSVIMNAPANADYAAAPTVTQFTTAEATASAPTVTFTGAPTSAAYGATFTVTASTNASSIPTITTSATGPCSVGAVSNSGPGSYQATVTIIKGTGTCTLTAKWAADSMYTAASATQKTTVGKVAPTVSFTGAPPTAGDNTSFTVTATSNEAGTYAVTPTMTATGSCKVGSVSNSGPGSYQATVTMDKATATCKMTAKWAASTGYDAASVIQTTAAN